MRKRSAEIANALVDGILKGNMNCARMLLDLTERAVPEPRQIDAILEMLGERDEKDPRGF